MIYNSQWVNLKWKKKYGRDLTDHVELWWYSDCISARKFFLTFSIKELYIYILKVLFTLYLLVYNLFVDIKYQARNLRNQNSLLRSRKSQLWEMYWAYKNEFKTKVEIGYRLSDRLLPFYGKKIIEIQLGRFQ